MKFVLWITTQGVVQSVRQVAQINATLTWRGGITTLVNVTVRLTTNHHLHHVIQRKALGENSYIQSNLYLPVY